MSVLTVAWPTAEKAESKEQKAKSRKAEPDVRGLFAWVMPTFLLCFSARDAAVLIDVIAAQKASTTRKRLVPRRVRPFSRC